MPASLRIERGHPEVSSADPAGHLRLVSCPRCAGRSRALVEVEGRLKGCCLGCGGDLSVPLDTERRRHVVIVGRAGQGILGLADD